MDKSKFIIFYFADSLYAMDFSFLREALIQTQYLKTGFLHPCIEGMVNIRGDVIPVLNPYNTGINESPTLLLVIRSGIHMLSFFCSDIIDIIPAAGIAVSSISRKKADYIYEYFKYNDRCVNIIDIEKFIVYMEKNLDTVHKQYKESF